MTLISVDSGAGPRQRRHCGSATRLAPGHPGFLPGPAGPFPGTISRHTLALPLLPTAVGPVPASRARRLGAPVWGRAACSCSGAAGLRLGLQVFSLEHETVPLPPAPDLIFRKYSALAPAYSVLCMRTRTCPHVLHEWQRLF